MVGQRIAEARGRAGLTQAQLLAAVVALDRSALTTTEAGDRRVITRTLIGADRQAPVASSGGVLAAAAQQQRFTTAVPPSPWPPGRPVS
jgi:hypothetical protein